MVGSVGHLLILVSFAACGAAAWFYYRAARAEGRPAGGGAALWQARGRTAWYASLAALTGASVLLMHLILSHQFQYNYVYSYTSLDLPWFYTFSAFWAGQEGSFLLWILFNGLVGAGIIRRSGGFEAPVMALVALCQLFLISMILGLEAGTLTLGVSPFQLLAERYPDAAALQQPGFVPADGQGLNDLLQNPWMVIHPPVLFVGFAAMLAPFAYAVAGLWQRRYTEWVHPGLPWVIFANLALMAGIALGGYWAYETLSFGGYWAWDPVENTSLVPWLVSVGALHAMVAQRKSGTNLRASFLLNIAAFLLVIYSTFLTRSGVLSDLSVHSFVDLGLYNQLLLWILTMAVVGFGLYAAHHRSLPVPDREVNVLSREFLIFSGAMLLALLGLIILVGTSAPILGRLFQENPSAVDIAFYNEWSVPMTAAIAFVLGLAQLVWWTRMTRAQLNDAVFRPMLFATVCTAAILLLTPFVETVVATQEAGPIAEARMTQQSGLFGAVGAYWGTLGQGLLMVLLLFAAFFAVYSNAVVLWRVGRGTPRMIGGAVAHVGFLLMVLGIVASSLFSNALSDGQHAGGKETFVVEEGRTVHVEGYRVRYLGRATTERGRTSYRLDVQTPAGRQFEARPIAYKNDRGQWFQSPDTRTFGTKDLFLAVSPREMFEQNGASGTPGELVLPRGDTTFTGDGAYAFSFVRFETNMGHDDSSSVASGGIRVAAVVEVTDVATGTKRTLRPVYAMGDGQRGAELVPAEVPEWKLAVRLVGMQADNGGVVRLQVDGADVRAETKDWLVVQAYEKPLLNVLWFGLVVMLGGFAISIYRRVGDDRVRYHRALPPEARG